MPMGVAMSSEYQHKSISPKWYNHIQIGHELLSKPLGIWALYVVRYFCNDVSET
jgi:hypothetical protein